MSEPTDVVDRQADAYRDRDLERFLACYAADTKVRDFDGNVLIDGLEAMRGWYGTLFRDSPQLRADIPRRFVAGDYVIDEEYGSGIVMAGFPPTEHIAVVYRVRDGLMDDAVPAHVRGAGRPGSCHPRGVDAGQRAARCA